MKVLRRIYDSNYTVASNHTQAAPSLQAQITMASPDGIAARFGLAIAVVEVQPLTPLKARLRRFVVARHSPEMPLCRPKSLNPWIVAHSESTLRLLAEELIRSSHRKLP